MQAANTAPVFHPMHAYPGGPPTSYSHGSSVNGNGGMTPAMYQKGVQPTQNQDQMHHRQNNATMHGPPPHYTNAGMAHEQPITPSTGDRVTNVNQVAPLINDNSRGMPTPLPPSGILSPAFVTRPQPGFPVPGPPVGMTPLPPPPGMAPMSNRPTFPPAPPPQPGYQSGFSPASPQGGFQPGFPPVPPQGGYQPGFPPPPPTFPGGGLKSPAMSPAGPPQRLNADHLPSAVQVQEDDRQKRSGPFDPNDRAKAPPPLVTTDFHSQEVGESCSPRFMRASLYQVPLTGDALLKLNIPFAVTCTPFAPRHQSEQAIPCSDMGAGGPLRCVRCKAYMNPSMRFTDAGRRFLCGMCGGSTEVPEEYFMHLDPSGRRGDYYHRPELCLASFEIAATAEYCRNDVFPQPPVFMFALDVSAASVKSGLLQLICSRIRSEILPFLPREEIQSEATESPVRVGFMTYDNVIHFYNLKPCLTQPQVMVVSDVEDVFVPLVDGLFVKPQEADALLESLLDMVQRSYASGQPAQHSPPSVLGPAIQAALEAFKAANCSGKLFVFHSELPSGEAPGKLRPLEERKGSQAEKEKISPFYTELGQSCVKQGVSVDMFLFPHAFVDALSLAEVPKHTGGALFKYTNFQAHLQGEQFLGDLRHAVSTPYAFDAVLRLRSSAGTRPVAFYGNFHMSNTRDMDLACLTRNTSLTCEVKYDDKLVEGEPVLLQLACLYTSLGGKRRIRVHNLRLHTTSQPTEIFRTGDLDALMNVLMKESLHLMAPGPSGGGKGARDVREQLAHRCIRILAAYRTHCSPQNAAGELVLPEQMKLLPLYCNSLANCDILNPGMDVTADDRAVLLHYVNGMTVAESNAFLYPRLLPLHNVDTESTGLPPAVRCSADKLDSHGAYILENGVVLFIWFGPHVSTEWMANVFGVPSSSQLLPDRPLVPQENPFSVRVFSILDTVKVQRSRSMQTVIVRPQDRTEMWFKRLLVEDRGEGSCPSYLDYLCNVHKEVRSILNN